MSDLHQNGPIVALPRLHARPIEDMEREILLLKNRFPVALVIPMIPSEMDRPALRGILDELCRVPYLESLVISLNKASADDLARAKVYFDPYPGRKVIVWSESRGVQSVMERMDAVGLHVGSPGKGRACWLALGYLLAREQVDYIAFFDADVVTFSREMLARLVRPAMDPILDYDFVKAYYARFSERLYGRVTRLFVSPLLAALARLIGPHPYLHYLSSFRYPLSGEFAVQRDLASRMRLPSDWGLEIVSLFEVLRHRAPERMCQVEIAERYEHKHQDLSRDDPGGGLNRMARDVGTHLFRTLAAAGVTLSEGLFKSLVAAYQRDAEDAVADGYATAVMNGLAFDRHAEEVEIGTFAAALRASIAEFLADPAGPPLLPNWARVWSGLPEASAMLLAAAEEV